MRRGREEDIVVEMLALDVVKLLATLVATAYLGFPIPCLWGRRRAKDGRTPELCSSGAEEKLGI